MNCQELYLLNLGLTKDTFIPMIHRVLLSLGTKPVAFRERVKECSIYACT